VLDVIRRGQRWLTAIFVVGIGGVFAIFIGVGSPIQRSSANAVIVVGSQHVGVGEFQRMRTQSEQQYRDALGDSFDARALSETLDNLTARTLVERAVLAMEAERLGLVIAKQEVEREILSYPAFRDATGRFDRDAFQNWVYYEYGSERAFREQQRRSALATKLVRVLRTQALVSEGEARESVRRRVEKVRIAFTVLDTSQAPQGFERSPEAIAAALPQREGEARKLYEERADEYDVPEQTRARHVLLRVPADASEQQIAEVEERAQAVLARLKDGEDFATVAEEVSEDPGSRVNGGDLGYFRRGQMVPAFDEAAFSLEPGVLPELVRTEYGFHILRVEDRKPAQHRPFEEVREDLVFELLGRSAAREQARATAERVAAQVRSGESLETAARNEELTLERSGWLTRRPDGYVPGLGAAQDLMAVAFTLETGQSSDRIFEAGERLALVQVLERQQPSQEEVDAELETEQKQLSQQKHIRLIETWISQRRSQLADDGELIVNLEAIRGRS
jgi:peptidyl-prolyl cis-trans isomerase D